MDAPTADPVELAARYLHIFAAGYSIEPVPPYDELDNASRAELQQAVRKIARDAQPGGPEIERRKYWAVFQRGSKEQRYLSRLGPWYGWLSLAAFFQDRVKAEANAPRDEAEVVEVEVIVRRRKS